MIKLAQYSFLSIIGSHAGEEFNDILIRKKKDIQNVGKTFWVINSYKAKPNMIQTICNSDRSQAAERLCAFLEPSSIGGSVPTKTSLVATEYSVDMSKWEKFPSGIGPVTGKITRSACALVFDDLSLCEFEALDLWQYADFFNQDQPVKILQGASTIGVIAKNTSTHPNRMKSHLRQIVAVGKLSEPFAVWLR